MTLSDDAIKLYRDTGHVTVAGIFETARMDDAIADAAAWGKEVLAGLSQKDRAWYLDGGVKGADTLRKLDNPVFFRPHFRQLAADARLTDAVEALIGPGLRVAFSQIFFKPPWLRRPQTGASGRLLFRLQHLAGLAPGHGGSLCQCPDGVCLTGSGI